MMCYVCVEVAAEGGEDGQNQRRYSSLTVTRPSFPMAFSPASTAHSPGRTSSL